MSRIEKEDYNAILADEALMQTVRHRAPAVRRQRAACHGRDGKGGANYPDLTDDDWLWGGGPALIEQTLRVGINTQHPESRIADRCPPSDATRCSTATRSGASRPMSTR